MNFKTGDKVFYYNGDNKEETIEIVGRATKTLCFLVGHDLKFNQDSGEVIGDSKKKSLYERRGITHYYPKEVQIRCDQCGAVNWIESYDRSKALKCPDCGYHHFFILSLRDKKVAKK